MKKLLVLSLIVNLAFVFDVLLDNLDSMDPVHTGKTIGMCSVAMVVIGIIISKITKDGYESKSLAGGEECK